MDAGFRRKRALPQGPQVGVEQSAAEPAAGAAVGPEPTDVVAFEEFLKAHGKAYADPEEYDRRLRNWLAARAFVEGYRAAHPDAAFSVRLNHFADMGDEERSAMFVPLPARPGRRRGLAEAQRRGLADPQPLSKPTKLDWRDPSNNPLGINAVTPVKQQVRQGGGVLFVLVCACVWCADYVNEEAC